VISSRPYARRALALVVVAFSIGTAFVGAGAGAPARFLILDTTFGLVFVVAGLTAWERRPEVRCGPLLILASALWFVGSYAPAGLVPESTLGFAFERYYDLVLAYLALTFPAAPLTSRTRLVLGIMGGAFIVRSVSRLIIDCACMPNPFALVTDPVLFDRIQLATTVVIAGAALVVAAFAATRLRGTGKGARRILRPVVVAGVVAALVAAWDAIDLITFIASGEGLLRFSEPWREIASWLIIAAVSLVPIGFLVGVVRLRMAHGPLAALALELDRSPDPGRLQYALRHALGDPSLELLRWDRDTASWLDAHGLSVTPPKEDSSIAVTTLERDGEAIAAIVHDRVLQEDPGMVAAATAVLRLAVENERLSTEVREQLAFVRASRARLVEAAEAERRRIERDLHDGAQQRLIGIALSLQEARAEARRQAPDAPFLMQLDDTAEELLAAIDELRELARGIHPAVLTDDGLGVAVKSLTRRAAVPVELNLSLNGRLPPAIEATAFYVVAEALTNVTRHARARSVSVRVAHQNALLEIEVEDDGDGGADARFGTGINGLVDRLDAVSGTLEIHSPSGGGTHLKAIIPCE
jgi:signal transduction histidine kinase